MANKAYEENDIANIAANIREKTGSEKKYTVAKMAEGVGEVYERGKYTGAQLQSNEMWDTVQDKGTRPCYEGAFAFWACDEVRPLYKVKPTISSPRMFYDSSIRRIDKALFDLSQAYYASKNYTSSCTTRQLCWGCSYLEVFPDISLQAGNYQQTFAYCYNLHTIEILRFKEEIVIESSTFTMCKSLKNITIEGTIGNSISFADCPLSVDTMYSILSHLKNFTGVIDDKGNSLQYTRTLTISSEAYEYMQEIPWYVEFEGRQVEIDSETYLASSLCWKLIVVE